MMIVAHLAPPFPTHLTFPDIDAAELAREDAGRPMPATDPWDAYLHRILPPAQATQSAASA